MEERPSGDTLETISGAIPNTTHCLKTNIKWCSTQRVVISHGRGAPDIGLPKPSRYED